MPQSRRRRFPVLLACALFSFCPLPATAEAAAPQPDILLGFDGPPEAGSPVATMLLLGTERDWAGEVADGHYHLYNTSAPSSLTYFFTGLDRGGAQLNLAAATVTLDVAADYGDSDAGAGILYRYDPAGRTYLAFMVTQAGYAVWVKDGSGLSRTLSGELPAGPATGEAHLTVRTTTDGMAQFLVGDEVVASLANGAVTGPQVGFAAFGVGEFSFDNFAVYQSGAAPAAEAAPAPEAAASATPPALPSRQYYVAENGQPVGPLSLDEVAARVAAGSVGPQTLVWVENTPDWVTADTLPELSEALAR